MAIRRKLSANMALVTVAGSLILATSSLAQEKKAPPPVEAPTQADRAKPSKRTGDRWLVKTASDPDVMKVKTTANKTTIEKLLEIPRPAELPLYETPAKFQDKRIERLEKALKFYSGVETFRPSLTFASGAQVILQSAAMVDSGFRARAALMDLPDDIF